jgi:hypothetical protein
MAQDNLRPKGTSTRERRWDLLNSNVEEHLADMPQVQPLHTELKSMAGEVRALDNEQEEVRSRLRDIVQRRRELERRGELVRRRIEAHLRGTFGFTNEQLIKFGVKPRPRVIRRKKTQENPEQQAPATQKAS